MADIVISQEEYDALFRARYVLACARFKLWEHADVFNKIEKTYDEACEPVRGRASLFADMRESRDD